MTARPPALATAIDHTWPLPDRRRLRRRLPRRPRRLDPRRAQNPHRPRPRPLHPVRDRHPIPTADLNRRRPRPRRRHLRRPHQRPPSAGRPGHPRRRRLRRRWLRRRRRAHYRDPPTHPDQNAADARLECYRALARDLPADAGHPTPTTKVQGRRRTTPARARKTAPAAPAVLPHLPHAAPQQRAVRHLRLTHSTEAGVASPAAGGPTTARLTTACRRVTWRGALRHPGGPPHQRRRWRGGVLSLGSRRHASRDSGLPWRGPLEETPHHGSTPAPTKKPPVGPLSGSVTSRSGAAALCCGERTPRRPFWSVATRPGQAALTIHPGDVAIGATPRRAASIAPTTTAGRGIDP